MPPISAVLHTSDFANDDDVSIHEAPAATARTALGIEKLAHSSMDATDLNPTTRQSVFEVP